MNKYKIKFKVTRVSGLLLTALIFLVSRNATSQYKESEHRNPLRGEISVTLAGCFGEAGKTYLLGNDITAEKSAVFLGKDVTLDLNGYTLTYADGGYEHIPNYSFEEGLKYWDVTRAPGALIADTRTQVMIGDKVLTLKEGDEIVSEYISLPIKDRSYFAMCGVAKPDMKISIFVDDEKGEPVRCISRYGTEEMISCPAENISPRLGGGIIYAHLTGLPAGKYRIRIKAITDCIIDYADIRPAGDVGIGIIKEVQPRINYKYLYESIHGAFYDYASDEQHTQPLAGIPVVKGRGTVTIKNGTIRCGTEGILSRAIQCNADSVLVVLDNLKIITSGINATAAEVPAAVITGCSVDVTNPFIINRHGSDNYGVDLWGKSPSEVSFSEFYGGQGCLVFKGDFSKIHHNFFANRQTVTNHYSIMAMGDSSFIFDNTIIPETGSGIEIYVHRGMEIFNNRIKIRASPPTCEYGHEDYSTTAIRIADYNALPGSVNASFGNKVYNNRIEVLGKDYPYYQDYVPMAWAVFYSASGGDNYIFGNEVKVEDMTPELKNETSAFYIGGGSIGGVFENNTVETNVPAFWVACRYGSAANTTISHNTIIKSQSADSLYKPVRMGWYNNIAKNIVFRSNMIEGSLFAIDKTDKPHSYSVSWTLIVKVTDRKGSPLAGAEITILDAAGTEVFKKTTNSEGFIKAELEQYSVEGPVVHNYSPFTLVTGKKKTVVDLKSNQEVIIND